MLPQVEIQGRSQEPIRPQRTLNFASCPNSYMLRGKQMEEAMGMLIIRHKVKDYGKWRPMFDEHSLMQKAAGLSNPRVFRSADSLARVPSRSTPQG